MNWLALIPMREKSKSIEKKNIKKILGKPMYEYTLENAIEAGANEIYISTDIKKILEKKFNNKKIITIKRKESLAQDNTTMEEVIYDFLKYYKEFVSKQNKVIVLLQPTSPLRRSKDIKNSLDLFNNSDKELLMSVTKTDNRILKYGFLEKKVFLPISKIEYCFQNRQELPTVYKPNGAIYIFNSNWFFKNKGFVTESIITYEMKKKFSHDVDSINDLKKVHKNLRKKN